MALRRCNRIRHDHAERSQFGDATMIRQLLATGTSAFALVVASPVLAHEEHFETESAPAEESTTPTMDFGEWGVGLDLLDPNVAPGDDFNAYVNGKWIAANEIPADRQRFGAFDMLREGATQDVKSLVEGLHLENRKKLIERGEM